MKGKRIITEEKSELLEFAEEYIQSHHYVNSRDLANIYENRTVIGKFSRDKPPTGLVCRFGQVLRILTDGGLVYRYNNRQYRVIK